jgi:ribosomal protein S6
MHYSLDYVITEFADEKAIQKINEEVEKIIAENSGKILEKREIGRKKLAYEIGKNQFGTYYNLIIETPIENINKIQTEMKNKEELIRALIIKIKYAPEMKKIESLNEARDKEKPEKIEKPKKIEKTIESLDDTRDKEKIETKPQALPEVITAKVESPDVARDKETPKDKKSPDLTRDKTIAKSKKAVTKKPDKSKEIISKMEEDKDTMKKLDEQLEEILKE